MVEGLPCLNCKADVTPDKAKLFAGVFVCETCHAMAERMYKRSEKELRDLQTMLLEGIRIALVEGRLQFAEDQNQELPKEDVLKAIVELQTLRDARKGQP